MKNIKVLGSGCSKCKVTATLIAQTAQKLGVEISIEKIEDFAQIVTYGVMATPSVVIDDAVVHTGSVPSAQQVERWLA